MKYIRAESHAMFTSPACPKYRESVDISQEEFSLKAQRFRNRAFSKMPDREETAAAAALTEEEEERSSGFKTANLSETTGWFFAFCENGFRW